MNSKNLDTLPEEIRSHILSLMPTKFAVRTSVLSKSWRYSWTSVTNLDIDDDDDDTRSDLDSLTKTVNRVFRSYKHSKLNLFRLHFGGSKKQNFSNCIDEAVKLNVRELDIRFNRLHDPPRTMFDLPLSLFTCRTLKKLTLDHVYCIWECPSLVSLPCLKTLDTVVYSNPFVNAFKLIHGCPVLESLSLQVEWCEGEQHYVFSIPTLKRLKLTMTNGVSVFHKVILRLPVLEYLCVGGYLSSLYVMEDLPALVEASVSSRSASTPHIWIQFLKGLSGVKSLSLHDMIFDVSLPIFPNMKHLELKLFWDYGVIPRFLECCPELKHLCLGMKSSLSIWMEPKVVPGCIHTNLTTLKCTPHERTTRYDINFLKYMLGNAEVLKTVTITCEQLSLEQETRLYAEVLKFPKASMDCAIKTGRSRFALLI